MQTRHFIVTIHNDTHFVRSTSTRAAKAAAIADRVSSRLATSDEIVNAVRAGVHIIGEPIPNEAAIDAAVDAFVNP